MKVQGESVSQITVNGRTFFMGDRRAALDNLPAKVVEQIKVTDKESDMEKITGIRKTGASQGKNMDVSLKQEYSQGLFGNLRAYGGASIPDSGQDELVAQTPFLWNTAGMLSFFGKKDQMTLIGRGENVDAGNVLKVRRGDGITTGGQAGVNLTTDRFKKMDPSFSIYYNGTSKEDATRSSSLDYPLSGEEVEGHKTSSSLNRNQQLKASLKISNKRSLKGLLFMFSPNFTFQDRMQNSLSASSSLSDGSLRNQSDAQSASHTRSLGSNGSFTLASSRFAKKGRSVWIDGSYSLSGSQGDSRDYSVTSFAAGGSQLRDLRYDQSGSSAMGSINVKYGEPLAKNWILQTGLSGQIQYSSQGKDAFNADGSANAYYSSASRNNTMVGRGSTLLQYQNGQLTIQAGVSLSADNLYTYSKSLGKESELGKGEWQWKWAPVFQLTSGSLELSYSGQSSQPQQSQMLSLLDITDPLRLSTGNLYLRPGFVHSISLSSRSSRSPLPRDKQKHFFLGGNLRATIRQNGVVSATWFDADRVRYSIPVNARRPGLTLSTNLNATAELGKKRAWRLMSDAMVNYSRSVNYQPAGTLSGMDTKNFDYAAFMADIWGDASGSRFYSGDSGFRESLTRQLNYREELSVRYNQPGFLDFTLINVFSGSHAWYSLDSQANSNTYVYSLKLDASYTTPHGFRLGGYYGLERYFGYSDTFARVNNNLGLSLMKEYKAFTFSLQARDLLNNGLTVSHAMSATGTTDSYQLSMGRHFLLGVVWHFGRMGNVQLRRANQSADSMMRDF